MKRRRVFSFVAASFLLGISNLLPYTPAQAQEASIAIRLVGNTFEIIQTIREARKVLKVGFNVLVEKGIYDSLYADFVDGRLDLQVDKVNTLPRWNRLLARDLVQSELTFQWKMVHFLESRGLRDDRSRILRQLKGALFSEQEAFNRGNRDEAFFNNVRGQRQALIRLRNQL
ncbi:MAG TPA: hypothetical protein VJO34_05420 [Methylomirabilota bacterium]|nr:hypothetical protein [Methylomirabilota bacterium]